MSDIERYQPQASTAIDSWVEVIAPVAELAERISNTEFVPQSLRGKPAAVTAAILTGREMGIGPMVALRHIHVIKGTPGQSAQLMRALVQAEGHQIRDIETTDTRCVVEGRRRGEEEWTRVAFTADQARKAGIQLGGYPEDKLYARATSRLCRRQFADIIAGMPYTTDELEDVDEGQAGPSEPPASDGQPSARRTARRRTQPKTKTSKKAAAASTETEQAPDTGPPEPPLPDEDRAEPLPIRDHTHDVDTGGNCRDPRCGYNTDTAVGENPDASGAAFTESDDGSGDEAAEPMITPDQSKKLHALFGPNNIHVDSRDERMHASSVIVGRPLATSSELTRDEASTLIDTLELVASHDNPTTKLAELIAVTENTEQGDRQ